MSTPSDLVLSGNSLQSLLDGVQPEDERQHPVGPDEDSGSEPGLLARFERENIDRQQSGGIDAPPLVLTDHLNPGVRGRSRPRINFENPPPDLSTRGPRINFETPRPTGSRPRIIFENQGSDGIDSGLGVSGLSHSNNDVSQTRSNSLRDRVEVLAPEARSKRASFTKNMVANGVGGAVLGAVIAGAVVGSVVPVIGTVIGAAVGLGAGLLFGAFRAAKERGDYFDTTGTGSQGKYNKLQRSTWFFLPRSMLGRNLFNAVRGAPGISLLGRAKKLVHCTDAPSLKKNDSGIPATPEQARQHLRYAVAMKTAYAGNQTRFSSTGGYREDLAKNRKELLPYLRSPDTLSFEQKSKLIENDEVYYPPKVQKSEKKEYRAAIEKKYALRHKMYTKTWRKEAGFRSVDPVGDHQHVEAWAFEAIGEHPGRHLNPEAEAIYDGLPTSLQRSLSGDEETTGAWEGEFKDKWTGNHITLNYDSLNREVIVAFNGTEDDTTFNSNIGNYLGQVPPSVKQACKVGAAVRDSVRRYNERMQGELGFKSIKVVSVGHSRGGMMAQAEAIRNGGRAVTMNPEPLGFAVRAYVGVHDSSKVKPKTEITNLSVNDEWLSGKSGMRKVGRGLEYAWGGTPMVYGDRLAMDPAPGLTGTKDKHAAFLAHVGYLAGSV